MSAETHVASIEDLLAALARDYEDGATVWFRGHERADWPLIPTIARDPSRVHAEMTLIKNFQQSALPFSPHKPASEWDWLFLMQHYGAPTRLLDWSEGSQPMLS